MRIKWHKPTDSCAIIYVLTDFEGNVFYVGCTIMALEFRLSGHISEARKNWPYTNTAKNEKIRSLKYRILITEIDRIVVNSTSGHFASRQAKQLEQMHIANYYRNGCPLVNGPKELKRALQSTQEPINADSGK